jgi:hypothetical protein
VELCNELYRGIGSTIPGHCRGDLWHSRDLLVERGFDPETSIVLFERFGGHCDCEVLMNVESTRYYRSLFEERAR